MEPSPQGARTYTASGGMGGEKKRRRPINLDVNLVQEEYKGDSGEKMRRDGGEMQGGARQKKKK